MFLILIRWNEKGRWVQDFLLLPHGFQSFPSDLPWARWHNVVCEFVCVCVCVCVCVRAHACACACSVFKWLSQWWFVFILLGVDATLGNECGIWEHLHSFRELKCVQDYSKTLWRVHKTLSLSPLAVEYSVVVMTGGFQSRRFQIESYA